MRLGIVGTGHIARALVIGLCSGPGGPERVLVSPRGAAVAAELAGRFRAVTVAAGNQEVVDGAEVVVLGLRPQDAGGALAGLRFRPEQVVISLVALLPLAAVRAAVAPARLVCRCLPLPTIARRRGPIVLHPELAPVRALLAPLGELVPAGSEAELEDLWVPTALIAAFYHHLATVAGWCARRGVPPERADAYTRALFEGLAGEALAARGVDLAELAAAARTKGGLNEQVQEELEAAGAFAAVERAMDRIAARLAAAHPSAGRADGPGRGDGRP